MPPSCSCRSQRSALMAVGWKAAWRRAYYLPLALIAIAGAGASFLAKESGEPLAHTVRQAGKRVGEHPEQGDTAFVFAMLLAATLAVMFAVGALRRASACDASAGKTGFAFQWTTTSILYAISVPIALLADLHDGLGGALRATLVWKTNR